MTKRFTAIGGHHSPKAQTVEWLTPPGIIDALGGWNSFALDPCAPLVQPYPTAIRVFTMLDNGLTKSWGPPEDRTWLNPPYTADHVGKWLARLAEHGRGTALIFARTETAAFQRHVWARAAGLLFVAGRINFHLPDGSRATANAGAPVVLCAYGEDDLDALAAAAQNPEYDGDSVIWGRGLIPGHLVPLRLAAMVRGCDATWAEIVSEFFASHGRGPYPLADIYQHARSTAKARANNHVDEKVRQQLQHGPYERIQPGLWRATE